MQTLIRRVEERAVSMWRVKELKSLFLYINTYFQCALARETCFLVLGSCVVLGSVYGMCSMGLTAYNDM